MGASNFNPLAFGRENGIHLESEEPTKHALKRFPEFQVILQWDLLGDAAAAAAPLLSVLQCVLRSRNIRAGLHYADVSQ